MNHESRERIKTSEESKDIADRNGDHGQELREFFADGSWIARGEITDGPNIGKAWVKGHEGGVHPENIDVSALGITLPPSETSSNDWGHIVSGGKEPYQPKTGDNWFKPVIHHAEEIPIEHAGAELVAKEGVDQETDDQGRITYEQKKTTDQHSVVRRTYHEGYMVETEKFLTGKQQGRVSEKRIPLATMPIKTELHTTAGSLSDTYVRGAFTDRELSEEEKSFMTPDQQQDSRERMRKAVTLDLGGKWERSEE